jgi:hypothetical protein
MDDLGACAPMEIDDRDPVALTADTETVPNLVPSTHSAHSNETITGCASVGCQQGISVDVMDDLGACAPMEIDDRDLSGKKNLKNEQQIAAFSSLAETLLEVKLSPDQSWSLLRDNDVDTQLAFGKLLAAEVKAGASKDVISSPIKDILPTNDVHALFTFFKRSLQDELRNFSYLAMREAYSSTPPQSLQDVTCPFICPSSTLHGLSLPPVSSLLDHLSLFYQDDDVLPVRLGSKNTDMSVANIAKRYKSTTTTASRLNIIDLEFSSDEESKDCFTPCSLATKENLLHHYYANNDSSDSSNSPFAKYVLASEKGCHTGYHLDYFGCGVYIHVVSGRKLFFCATVSKESILTCLNHDVKTDIDKFNRHVRRHGGSVTACLVGAGESFFIPQGCVHAALTLEDTLGYSGNFFHLRNLTLPIYISKIDSLSRTDFPHWKNIVRFAANRLIDEFSVFGITDKTLCQRVCDIVFAIVEWSSDKMNSTDGADCKLAYNLAKLCKFCQEHPDGYVGMFFNKIFDDGKEYDGVIVRHDPDNGYECVYNDGDFEHLSLASVEKLCVTPPLKWTCTQCTHDNKDVDIYVPSLCLDCNHSSTKNNIPAICDRPFIKLDAQQVNGRLGVVPDRGETKTGKTWREGKVRDEEYHSLSVDARKAFVLREQEKAINGSNFKQMAAGKTFTHESFQGDIVQLVAGMESSGVNSKGVLIIDSGECEAEFKIKNVTNAGEQVGKLLFT